MPIRRPAIPGTLARRKVTPEDADMEASDPGRRDTEDSDHERH